jgi:hypothetical protein
VRLGKVDPITKNVRSPIGSDQGPKVLGVITSGYRKGSQIHLCPGALSAEG